MRRLVNGPVFRRGDGWAVGVAQEELKKEEDDRIQRRIQAYREVIGVKRSIHLTLITTFGLLHNAYRNHVQSEVTLDDLFRD